MTCKKGIGQGDYQLGWLPVINVNKKLKQDFKVNFKLETRQAFFGENDFYWKHQLVDLANVFSKKVGLSSSVAGGYLLRFRDNQLTFRLIQQYAIIQNFSSFRFSHRFVTDQTFQKNKEPKFRLRYRLSSLVPLNGQSIDHKEFYFKINNEYLGGFQKNNNDLEVRLSIYLGYKFTDNNKLEFGLDNRFDSFIKEELEAKTWVHVIWYISI